MEVELDPNKTASNLTKHGVTLDEAAKSNMRKEYDFTGARRAKDVPHLAKLQAETARGKTRITILIDDDVLAAFRARAEREGRGYQTLINAALRAATAPEAAPVTVEALRQILRQELQSR